MIYRAKQYHCRLLAVQLISFAVEKIFETYGNNTKKQEDPGQGFAS